jgi:hypothetical protein
LQELVNGPANMARDGVPTSSLFLGEVDMEIPV